MKWRRIEFLSLRFSPEFFFSSLHVQMQGSLVVLLSFITAVVVGFQCCFDSLDVLDDL
jgi:hypothetical protein